VVSPAAGAVDCAMRPEDNEDGLGRRRALRTRGPHGRALGRPGTFRRRSVVRTSTTTIALSLSVVTTLLMRPATAASSSPEETFASSAMLQTAFSFADVDKSASLDQGEFAVAIDRYEAAKHEDMGKAQARMFEETGGAAFAGGSMSASRRHHSVPAPPSKKRFTAAQPVGDDPSQSFSKAFVNSLGMIWATEIGDKTFFIAAVLAMRHSRCVVFSGALLALIVMTVLSAALGYALPSLLPRKYTHYASAALFLYFGAKMLRDARTMGDGPADELAEVEDELGEKTHKREDLESHGAATTNGDASSMMMMTNGGGAHAGGKRPRGGVPTLARVLSQAFVLTFLAEWGDRSQIATIALAAAKDPIGVTLGGITGHAMCTGLAVIGGRMLASKISERTVAWVGGALFLVFATYSLFFETVPDEGPAVVSTAAVAADALAGSTASLDADLSELASRS